ncbi:hypothetical protein HDE_14477 [Halotydeus destructor]|nr:hypothetical protein HDE_14477 [Halotydeus destructor]
MHSSTYFVMYISLLVTVQLAFVVSSLPLDNNGPLDNSPLDGQLGDHMDNLQANVDQLGPQYVAYMFRSGPRVRRVGSMGWGPGGTPISAVAGRYFDCVEKSRRTGSGNGACSSLLMQKRIREHLFE